MINKQDEKLLKISELFRLEKFCGNGTGLMESDGYNLNFKILAISIIVFN